MAAISSTTPNAATEPVLVYSAVSFANRAALRAAKVALNLPFAGAQLAKDDQPFVETAAMTSARLTLVAALCLIMQAPVQTALTRFYKKQPIISCGAYKGVTVMRSCAVKRFAAKRRLFHAGTACRRRRPLRAGFWASGHPLPVLWRGTLSSAIGSSVHPRNTDKSQHA